MARPDPPQRRRTGAPRATLGALAALLAVPAGAQVAPGGLGTRVNGTALGRCSTGVCRVQGGSTAGDTLFLRFSQYDTRRAIRRVDLDSRGRANVVVGVSHPDGSFFGAPLRLSEAANLFWLSPGGIRLDRGGEILGATNLLLSTAPSLRFGRGVFQAVGGLTDGLGGLGGEPALDLEALARGRVDGAALGPGAGPIVLAGGRLTIDRHLLLDSGAGPILSAPGGRTQLTAGRSVQLSGGEIHLRGVDVEAGTTAADDLVRLRSGPAAGGGSGALRLVEADLRGSRIVIEGAGGLELRQVEARAGGPAGGGVLQLSAGTPGAAAAARLERVTLAGGDVRLRSGGALTATDLQARAGDNGGGGRLRLEAGGSGGGDGPALRLERADLEGHSLEIRAAGAGELRQVRARAGGEGAPGLLRLGTEAAEGGAPGPLALEGVRLTGEAVVVEAAGDLRARDLAVEARDLWLRAEGDLALQRVSAEGEAIRVRGGNRVAVQDSRLRAAGERGLIQLEALSAGPGPGQGRLELEGSRLEGQAILGRADLAVRLRQVTARAGDPGRRGLIQLETGPAGEPAADGEMDLAGVRLEGQRLVLRSGSIRLSDSSLEAPKGLIHLEAKQGDLEVAASRLDVGVRSEADLATAVNRRLEVFGVVLNEPSLPPSVGMFAAGDLRILDGSTISASQDVDALRRLRPELGREQIRLSDTAGLVVADAGRGLSVRDSRLEADATDTLAGTVVLRARAEEGRGALTLDNAVLSASGGAGSGDLRLSSGGGLRLQGSRLLARADSRPENLDQPGQPDWRNPFSGGEITLTNSAPQRGLTIVDSQLRAEQGAGGRLLSPAVLDGRDGGLPFRLPFQDDFDGSDVGIGSVGGIINLISAGGVTLTGPSTRVSVDSRPAGDGPPESLGGSVRIVNYGAEPVAIRDGARLSAETGPPADPALPARAGEVLRLDPAPTPLTDDTIWGAGRDPNPYLLQASAETRDQLLTGGENFDVAGGIPGLIRGRVQPAPPDTLVVAAAPPGEQIQRLPAPPVPEAEALAAAAPAAPGPGPAAANDWITLPSPSLALPRIPSAATLALASPPPSAATALSVESSQAMPESAAVQAFEATEQEAARAVSAALGLARPVAPGLEIAALQQQLRAAIRPQAVAAILQISRAPVPGTGLVQLNHILIPASGEIRGWQTRVAGEALQRAIEAFGRQLSQQAPLDAAGPGERLSAVLLEPVLQELERQGIRTLLLALDRGLQGIPFAALPLPGGDLVERMALTITPALSLTDLTPAAVPAAPRRTLLAGASRFRNGLMPLPMAPQELRQVAALHPDALVLLDGAFHTRALLEQARSGRVEILHLATHAEFSRERADAARIYTGDGELSLAELGRELRRRRGTPLSLFVLNACRTALGDEQRELGIAGLALQAGASSALGNLWYVDDVVSAAFAVQFHRALQQGLRSDEALRLTQRLFRQGAIRVRGDRIVNAGGEVLLSGLSRADQARLAQPLDHPYYWAGAVLSGRPW